MAEKTQPGHVPEDMTVGAGLQKLELIIEDECCAAWMSINNTFRAVDDTWSEDASYWNGVMIQMGDFEPWKQSEALEQVFNGIRFERGGGPDETLSREQFEDAIYWVNVVAKSADDPRNPPVELEDFYKLYLHPLRNKSLHAFLQPMPGGITLWHARDTRELVQDEWEETSAYSMQVGPSLFNSNHSKFIFTITAENIEVSVHKFPTPSVRDWILARHHPVGEPEMAATPALDPPAPFDRIVVLADDGGGHGGHDNPPQG